MNFIDFISQVADTAVSEFSKIKDKATFNRIVWASYLIARADGNFDSDEKTALSKIIAKEFPQFKLTDIIDSLSKAEEKIDFDETFGVNELLQEIAKAKGEDAQLIVRTACYIGAADGDFDNDEKAVTKAICTRLKINPEDFGL